MPGTSAKRVILYRFDRQPLEGFVNVSGFRLTDLVELMTLEGNVQALPYSDVKAICFVQDSGAGNLFTEDSTFERRPKLPGLWVRFVFRDGDRLDGILPHQLHEWPEAGYLATPPKAGSQRQRVFLPRVALVGTELRGIIGKAATISAADRHDIRQPGTHDPQLTMFE